MDQLVIVISANVFYALSLLISVISVCGKKKALDPASSGAVIPPKAAPPTPLAKQNVALQTARSTPAKEKSAEVVKQEVVKQEVVEKKEVEKVEAPKKPAVAAAKPNKKEAPFAPAKEHIKTEQHQKTIEQNDEKKKGALISNPIVSNATDQFPTVSKQASKAVKMEKTQDSMSVKKTQKEV